jgi:hypothetical protein
VLSNFRNEQARDIVVVDDGARRTVIPYAVMPDTRFSSLIHQAAKETDLSPSLLHAVIAVESAFDARAVSPKGAKGLMQLMPATAFALESPIPSIPGRTSPLAPLTSSHCLAASTTILELALAAYNAGADAVIKAGYQIPRLPRRGLMCRALWRDCGSPKAKRSVRLALRRSAARSSERLTCHARRSRRTSASPMRDHTSSEQMHAAGRALSRCFQVRTRATVLDHVALLARGHVCGRPRAQR